MYIDSCINDYYAFRKQELIARLNASMEEITPLARVEIPIAHYFA